MRTPFALMLVIAAGLLVGCEAIRTAPGMTLVLKTPSRSTFTPAESDPSSVPTPQPTSPAAAPPTLAQPNTVTVAPTPAPAATVLFGDPLDSLTHWDTASIGHGSTLATQGWESVEMPALGGMAVASVGGTEGTVRQAADYLLTLKYPFVVPATHSAMLVFDRYLLQSNDTGYPIELAVDVSSDGYLWKPALVDRLERPGLVNHGVVLGPGRGWVRFRFTHSTMVVGADAVVPAPAIANVAIWDTP